MVALLIAFACQAETVTLNPPEGTDPKILAEAAQAIEKRISAYGYKDVTVVAEDGKVKVSCGTGITEEMRKRISVLGRWKAHVAEFAIARVLSASEKEQYSEGKSAPADSKWARTVEDDGMAFSWILIADPPILVVKTPIKPESVKVAKKWIAVINESKRQGGGVYTIIDGISLGPSWWAGQLISDSDNRWRDYFTTNKDGSWTWFPNSRLLDSILRHPLPIRLSMVTPPKK